MTLSRNTLSEIGGPIILKVPLVHWNELGGSMGRAIDGTQGEGPTLLSLSFEREHSSSDSELPSAFCAYKTILDREDLLNLRALWVKVEWISSMDINNWNLWHNFVSDDAVERLALSKQCADLDIILKKGELESLLISHKS